MNQAIQGLRVFAASVTVAVGLAGIGLAVAPAASANFGTVQAVTAVNVRSQPNAKSPILTVLYQGSTATQNGPMQNGFVPVVIKGIKGWVSSNYLTGARADANAPASASGTKATQFTLEAVNVRTGPSLESRSLIVLQKGIAVAPTGLVSRGFSQITFRGERAWISTAYLGATKSAAAPPAKQLSAARATTDLLLRSGSGSRYSVYGEIPRGTVINLTGLTAPGVAQVLYRGEYRWVNANYLAPVNSSTSPVVPKQPTTIGTQYATEGLNIRTSASTGASIITTVARGTQLKVTGKVTNGFAEISWNGASRWASAKYLSATKPAPDTSTPPTTGGDLGEGIGGSSGLSNLTPNAKGVVYEVRAKFTWVKTIYGVRPDPLPDHPTGHAVDLMIPNWSTATGNANGLALASYLKANASRLNIQYIIFDKKIWNVSRDSEGWRPMADRGSATANHQDHVHVTVK